MWLSSSRASSGHSVPALPDTVAVELAGEDLCGKLAIGDNVGVFGIIDLVLSTTSARATATVLVRVQPPVQQISGLQSSGMQMNDEFGPCVPLWLPLNRVS